MLGLREELKNPPMANYICEEIVIQILRYLPVKALLRFRCACKSMKRTIDSDSFMLDHLSLQKPQFILQSTPRFFSFVPVFHEKKFLALDPHSPPSIDSHTPILPLDFAATEKTFVLGTLHGVVCLYDNDIGLVLWNPSTRQHSIPPQPRLRYEMFYTENISHLPYYCGFWIDPVTKDFKAIICELIEEAYPLVAVLYNSVQGTWIELPEEARAPDCWCNDIGENSSPNARPAVMIGGSVNWICLYVDEEEVEEEEGRLVMDLVMVILSFDFGQERFDVIEMPEELGSDPVLFNWRGNLSVLCRKEELPNSYDVYSRQLGSWAKMYSIDVVNPVTKVLWVMGEREGQRRTALASTDDDLVLYDCEAAISSPLRVENWGSYDFFMAYDFVESLLFPYRR